MYDVFISCKSEDYPQAKGIYDFLNANGVNTFFASESLRKTGNTQYLNEIDAALDGCSNLIVFCTKAEYADSKYVKEEWQSFRNEKLSGRKKGNILTIVGKGVKIQDLPYGLRGYEVIEFHNYKDILLSYVGETQQNFENKPTPQPTPQPKPKKNFNLKLLLVLVAVIVIGLCFALLSGTTKEQQKSADNAFFQNCSSIADYRAYLNKYPNGINKELAENKVNKHVSDSIQKANVGIEKRRSNEELQRQIAAENERKAIENSLKPSGYSIRHAYVDLGLPSGTLWATCNVGAENPEDYGNYYAWGETKTKSTYDWKTYKWCRGSYDNLTKYNTKSDYGTVDNKKVLEMSDDAARANWGGNWRTPTCDDVIELKKKCNWEWTTQGRKNGYRVTGPNGKSIFLPAAGYKNEIGLTYDSRGFYWLISLSYSGSAEYLYFGIGYVFVNAGDRNCGRSVRPVCSLQN